MKSKDAGLYVFLGSLVLSIGLVTVGLYAANRAYLSSLDLQERRRMTDLALAGRLMVPRVDEITAAQNPAGEIWELSPGMEVSLLPQNVAMPAQDAVSVASVRLQGLTDGRWIVWKLSWLDDQPDMNTDTGRFTDAVALQFPISENASYMMGGPEMRVQILHWKALWQKDIDEQFQDVQDLHPNYWADLYWFAEGGAPYRVPGSFADERSHQWFPALEAGNPMSVWKRSHPVEELIAEGYGTLTHQTQSATLGRGVWRDGRWSVIFARPLATDDPLDYQFRSTGTGQVGVAVWNGASGNVGGRKQYSNWLNFELGS